MKVKVGQLKANLSRYLKDVRDTGDSIEVCLREETVAYLTPASPPGTTSPQPNVELERQLKAQGISVARWGRKASAVLKTGSCSSPAEGVNSVESIRAEKNW